MKKAILILCALMMVVAGVAAVSAYEAHIINIKTHVENALIVPDEVDLGTVFPQELLQQPFAFGLSNSFMAATQTRTKDVDYVMFWKMKPVPAGTTVCKPIEEAGVLYYQPLEPFLTLGAPSGSGDSIGVKPGYTGPMAADVVAYGNLNKDDNPCDVWHLIFAVPVFEEWYNDTTDPAIPEVLTPDQYCVVEESFTCPDGTVITGRVPHADLGSDLKIQVVGFSLY